MIIGKFSKQDEGYAGNLFGIGFGVRDVALSPVPAKLGDSQPDFVVIATLPEEEDGVFELGAAWKKTSKKGKADRKSVV